MAKDLRTAWDPETMGYGKHSYTIVDPDSINVEDFAIDMRGDEQHRGDVREENTAYNERPKNNTITLDLLSKIGTVFKTKVPECPGVWMVTSMPAIRTPEVFVRATRVKSFDKENKEFELDPDSEEQELSCVELGCAVDVENKFRQVEGEILAKGKHQNLG